MVALSHGVSFKLGHMGHIGPRNGTFTVTTDSYPPVTFDLGKYSCCCVSIHLEHHPTEVKWNHKAQKLPSKLFSDTRGSVPNEELNGIKSQNVSLQRSIELLHSVCSGLLHTLQNPH